ncbi:unnamed protein product [Linum tenue]|uniref:ABC transporter domain-containing protein n=1 Tax=Linum tenue TaxID=586396 RepID=A0AAV0GQA6_9ROSI|nr:unnamed protein product [Linum tenue]
MAGKILLLRGSEKMTRSSSLISCRDVSYVTQEDVFLGTLTVKETLYFGARLRLPELAKTELHELVDETMAKMGLEECADSTIGNWHLRGISSGERRRLSIAVAILAQPQVLCLDEATTGLDSAASSFVVQALRNVARDGKIVVCSVHQPTDDVFRLFDDLLLISAGEVVYFGESHGAVKFFADSGFPCPIRRNPPDHFLRCIAPEFDQVLAALKQTQRLNFTLSAADGLLNGTTAETRATLVKKYKSSIFADTARKRIQELELLALRGERHGGHYGEAVYVLSNFLSSLPFTIFISFSSGSILYSMVKFHPGFSHLLYFCINLFFSISVSEACVFVTASLISNPLPAMGAAIGVTVLNLMASMVIRPLPDTPKIFWRYPLSYISYAAWGTQGNLKNDMMGLKFNSEIPGRPKITGESILKNTYGMNLRYSKWWDVAALFCLLLAYRVLLVFSLHYKQRISTPLQRIYPRRGLKPTKIPQA